MSMGQRKILHLHEETNLRPSECALRCYTAKTQRLCCEQGLLGGSYDTCMSCILLGSAMLIASCLFIDLIDFLFTNIMVSNRDTASKSYKHNCVAHTGALQVRQEKKE